MASQTCWKEGKVEPWILYPMKTWNKGLNKCIFEWMTTDRIPHWQSCTTRNAKRKKKLWC